MAIGKGLGLKRGDIYLVNFDPAVGSEIKKTRPALVIQNDIGNRYSPVTIVAAITSFASDETLYPTEVKLEAQKGLARDSIILLNQIRTVDKRRLLTKYGTVSGEIMEQVDAALLVSLGLIEQ